MNGTKIVRWILAGFTGCQVGEIILYEWKPKLRDPSCCDFWIRGVERKVAVSYVGREQALRVGQAGSWLCWKRTASKRWAGRKLAMLEENSPYALDRQEAGYVGREQPLRVRQAGSQAIEEARGGAEWCTAVLRQLPEL